LPNGRSLSAFPSGSFANLRGPPLFHFHWPLSCQLIHNIERRHVDIAAAELQFFYRDIAGKIRFQGALGAENYRSNDTMTEQASPCGGTA